MGTSTANVVICGAGIAGISAAYHLVAKHGVCNVVLVDERAPLTLTSDKSTECYRNWWPGPGNAMVSLMNRSIDILEGLARQSGNAFNMNRVGMSTRRPIRLEFPCCGARRKNQRPWAPAKCAAIPAPLHTVPRCLRALPGSPRARI